MAAGHAADDRQPLSSSAALERLKKLVSYTMLPLSCRHPCLMCKPA